MSDFCQHQRPTKNYLLCNLHTDINPQHDDYDQSNEKGNKKKNQRVLSCSHTAFLCVYVFVYEILFFLSFLFGAMLCEFIM